MKKVLSSLLAGAATLFASACLMACGPAAAPDAPSGGTTGGSQSGETPAAPEYTVSFDTNGGSAISSVTGTAGTAVSPVTTTKKDYIFDGWYSDSTLKTAATVPSAIPQNDVKLYAKWISALDYFLAARGKLTSADSFEYDFDLDVTTVVAAAGMSVNGPTAITDGNIKYDKADSTSYLKVEANSGALLSDGTVYTFAKAGKLNTVKVNEGGKVYSYDTKDVDANFKYESSMYAKALFEFDDDDITSVTESSVAGKYAISYNSSKSGEMVQGALKILNSPLLSKFVSLPDIGNNVTCLVSFAPDGNIKTYEYDFELTVAGQKINFHYDLDVKHVGEGVNISDLSFPGIVISDAEIDAKLAEVTAALDAYRALTNSGYDYDVKTATRFSTGGTINSRTQGRTMRKIEGGTVYYWNRIEFDSDYKNGDLYKNTIKDYERYRAKLANGEVWDVEDKVGPINGYTEVESDDDIDAFYFLPVNELFNHTLVPIVQYGVTGDTKVYSIGLTDAAVKEVLGFIDDCVRVDVALAHDVEIFNMKDGSLAVNSVTFDVTLKGGKLYSIALNIAGTADGSYPDTEFTGAYDFSLKCSITVNDKGDSYTVPTVKNKVELPNG